MAEAGVADLAITALHLRNPANGMECVVVRACKVVRQARQVVVTRASALDEVGQSSAALWAGGGDGICGGLEGEAGQVHCLRGLSAETASAHSPVLAAGAVALVQRLCSGHAVNGGCMTPRSG